eukprot:CAMPEP_0116544916 /NCGR_PEP_ID=MMETSP0397-20121206/2377_1 /TAXON_ID=216820 /ORGANISM="Cyclophora tenuis, Strain ECT3854" /LENGTH=99 /DNA_ID=CAMNT_0004069169 /DNA_START=318 /DNA_END=614 /DNA_ORIENTATION=-
MTRTEFEPVPGCSGSGERAVGYCYDDSPDVSTPGDSVLAELDFVRECTTSEPCSLCQGDCDGNSQCGPGLKCYQRNGFETVPGCSGSGSFGVDYCYSDQ